MKPKVYASIDMNEARSPLVRVVHADEWDLLMIELRYLQGERRAVVAWLRGEPERLVACDGHRHADGKPCFVLSPMPADELADAIENGEHRREEER